MVMVYFIRVKGKPYAIYHLDDLEAFWTREDGLSRNSFSRPESSATQEPNCSGIASISVHLSLVQPAYRSVWTKIIEMKISASHAIGLTAHLPILRIRLRRLTDCGEDS
jgi:hypothetical protein